MSKALGCLDVIYRYVNAYCPTLFNFEFNEIKKDLEELEKIKSQVEVDMDIYDTEEIHENCTVQIWSNSQTGKISIGWWKNE